MHSPKDTIHGLMAIIRPISCKASPFGRRVESQPLCGWLAASAFGTSPRRSAAVFQRRCDSAELGINSANGFSFSPHPNANGAPVALPTSFGDEGRCLLRQSQTYLGTCDLLPGLLFVGRKRIRRACVPRSPRSAARRILFANTLISRVYSAYLCLNKNPPPAGATASTSHWMTRTTEQLCTDRFVSPALWQPGCTRRPKSPPEPESQKLNSTEQAHIGESL